MSDKKSFLFVSLMAFIGAVFVISQQQGVNAITDATSINPYLVKDIEPNGDSDPALFKAFGNKVYFSATQNDNSYELWGTDGSAGGTYMVKDINPFPEALRMDSGPFYMTVFNGMLYFSINDNMHGRELWKTDGTESGTVMVKDINSNEVNPGRDSDPKWLVEMNGMLYFTANDGDSTGLWKTDGTEANTQRIGDATVLGELGVVGNTLFFHGSYSPYGGDSELWKSDGTAAGTTLVKDIQEGYFPSVPEKLTAVNDTLFFTANTLDNGTELWRSDGTEAGTLLVKDIRPGSDPSYPDKMTEMNNTLYFSANDGSNGRELWKSDGSTDGTIMIKDIYPGAGTGFRPIGSNLPVINNELYFYGHDPVNGDELWKSDGTEAGTQLVKDIFPGTDSSTPLWFTTDGKTLFFTANDGVHGMELWQSDGTEAGTMMIEEIYPGNNSSGPTYLSAQGVWLFFSADDGINGLEPWAISLASESLFLPLIMSNTN